jgi:hypothetical protein
MVLVKWLLLCVFSALFLNATENFKKDTRGDASDEDLSIEQNTKFPIRIERLIDLEDLAESYPSLGSDLESLTLEEREQFLELLNMLIESFEETVNAQDPVNPEI